MEKEREEKEIGGFMLNWEELVTQAPKYQGRVGHSKTVYWGPDEDAVFGRYWDGTPISQHPKDEEISRYYAFWIAMSNSEQKETLQAMFDIQIAENFLKAYRGRSTEEIITEAIKWWHKFYPQEVKDFNEYIAFKKGTLRDPKGYDRTKAHKFQGAIPPRIKHLVMVANPDLVKYDGQSQSTLEKYFFKIYTKANIGGN
jgi:hypothetical protein